MADPSTIVILGGPGAGKSVFISALYWHLWKSHNGMLMRATNGTVHAELLRAAHDYKENILPAATQSIRRLEFELEYGSRMFYVRSLDYPGELFRRVFFDLAVDSDEARELFGACEGAGGLIVLIDPGAILRDPDEVDFTLSNLLRHVRSKPQPPALVFAFTKRDENERVIGRHLAGFVKRTLPHTSRYLLGGTRMMHFASIVKSEYAIRIAGSKAVCSPLQAVIREMDRTAQRAANERLSRRQSVTQSAKISLLIIAVLIGMMVMFLLGVGARQFVESQR